MTTKKKVPSRIVIDTKKKKPRKPNPSKTKFSKDNPSPTQFQPGTSGNPGGKVRTDRLLSKALNVALGDKAPKEACDLVQIPFGASWAMVLARRMLRLAMTQDWGIAAMREIREATEGTRGRLDVFGGYAGEDEEEPPMTRLAFIRSDGNGGVCADDLASFPELSAKTIEGQAARPALPAVTD
jgi:hypothetical protein